MLVDASGSRSLMLALLVAGCAKTKDGELGGAARVESAPAEARDASAADRQPALATPGAAGAVATGAPTTAAASDPCDALVRAAREGGGVGLRKESDPPLDPVCEW